MGWSDKNLCIKCDRGGKVLACSNSSCPLAVHEKCMSFPTKFDDMGKFYCPYCVYRRLVEESHRAREKAFSRKKALEVFLETKLINGDSQTLEFGNSKLKVTTQLVDAQKIIDPHIENDEKQLDKVNAPETVLEKKSQQQDRIAFECCKGASLSEEVDILFLGGPLVAYGNDYVDGEDEETTQRFEVVEIGNRVTLQPQQQNDGYQAHTCLENHREENDSVDPLVIEKKGKESLLSTTKKVLNETGTIQENIGNSGRTEAMEEQLDKTAALSHDEPALQVLSLERRGFEVSGFTGTDSKTVLNGKRVKYNDKSRDEGSDANCFRRPCHNSASALSAYIDHLEKTVVSIPSRLLTKPAATNKFFPDGRRKRLPWTEEETNTLKEGVTKFSTDMNKNIPWRKILDFGQNVFDGTRTPVDLKDKWRNMLTKERLQGLIGVIIINPGTKEIGFIPTIDEYIGTLASVDEGDGMTKNCPNIKAQTLAKYLVDNEFVCKPLPSCPITAKLITGHKTLLVVRILCDLAAT